MFVLSHVALAVAAVTVPALQDGDAGMRSHLRSVAHIEQKVRVPMRDGVRLSTDIYRPKDAKGPVPTIFWRTPYNFNRLSSGRVATILRSVQSGYAFVIQNERGRYFSEGDWEILGFPRTDGYDALTWIAEQKWSNGKVGTWGCSSSAEWQMALAAMDHPAHAAMVPSACGAGIGKVGRFTEQGNWYRGGAFQMLFATWLHGVQSMARPDLPEELSDADIERLTAEFAAPRTRVDWNDGLKHLPLTELLSNVDGPTGAFDDLIRRFPNDPAWYDGGLYHDHEGFGVPSLWLGSWYDVSIGPNLELFNHARRADDPAVSNHQYVVVAPTPHCRFSNSTGDVIVGERNMGEAGRDFDGMVFRWFDYWLKGEENGFVDETPAVQYYTMGLNQWQSSTSWPPAGAEYVTWYLDSDGAANSSSGDGRLIAGALPSAGHSDTFTYDPKSPVPSHGGGVCCTGGAVQPGSFDQRENELRHDVLVYTSVPLQRGVMVSGAIEATLFVSSDARDTDFTVKLVDVLPDGTAYNVDETIQRVRYREGYDTQVMMEEGEVYRVPISPMSTSNYFAPGHRIRIEITSSNFPRFARNLNTGGNNFDEKDPVVARNTVHHSTEHPSQIRLPIVSFRAE